MAVENKLTRVLTLLTQGIVQLEILKVGIWNKSKIFILLTVLSDIRT